MAKEIADFVAERDWGQFHTPENLAKSIAIEAGELLECFQWSDAVDRSRVLEELADVLSYCQMLATALDADVDAIVRDKLALNAAKYPVERARGTAAKYGQLPD